MSKTGANRSPSSRETVACVTRHFGRELEIIRPRVIFAFGAKAALGHPVTLCEVQSRPALNQRGIRVIPLLHPSTINLAGMRRVGIRSLEQYEEELAATFRREIESSLLQLDAAQARPLTVN